MSEKDKKIGCDQVMTMNQEANLGSHTPSTDCKKSLKNESEYQSQKDSGAELGGGE